MSASSFSPCLGSYSKPELAYKPKFKFGKHVVFVKLKLEARALELICSDSSDISTLYAEV